MKFPYQWIARRARRIARFYNVDRREAIEYAWCDWKMFTGDIELVG